VKSATAETAVRGVSAGRQQSRESGSCHKENVMNETTRCFVDAGGRVYVKDAADADHCVRTSEELMTCAEQGRLPKSLLVSLLDVKHRQAYLDACAAIEKKYTEDCTATNDPCLESGCAVEDGICLQPLLRAGIEYHKACATEWIKWFADPRNRIDAWKH
jgi:hypothetical protein